MAIQKKKITTKLKEKIKKIKVFAFDVDGVLTDGRVFWQPEGWTRVFNVVDGYGLNRLKKFGIERAMITAASATDVKKRAEWLKIEHVYTGSEDKLTAFEDLVKKTGRDPEEISYIGDELFDIPVLKEAGFSASVPNARNEVKKITDWVTRSRGGDGAVREMVDLILKVQKR